MEPGGSGLVSGEGTGPDDGVSIAASDYREFTNGGTEGGCQTDINDWFGQLDAVVDIVDEKIEAVPDEVVEEVPVEIPAEAVPSINIAAEEEKVEEVVASPAPVITPAVEEEEEIEKLDF